jgi:hypothetical protein
MGNNYTKAEKETYLKYQPLVHEACTYPAKFKENFDKIKNDLRLKEL